MCAGLTLVNVCVGRGAGTWMSGYQPDTPLPWATCTLAEARSQKLVALGTVAGEATWLIDAPVLAEITGVAAFINV